MTGPKVGEIVASIYNPDFLYRVLTEPEKGRVDVEVASPAHLGLEGTRYNGVAIKNLKPLEG